MLLVALKTERSFYGIIQCELTVKDWLERLPSAAAVRPSRCPRCHAVSQEPGRSLTIHGHGLVWRQQWGPATADGLPEVAALVLRRYQCQECWAVMRVGPRGLVEHHRYAAAAIAMALCLWLVVGLAQATVRERVGVWFRRSKDADAERRWRSLSRWSSKVDTGRLWPELAKHRSVVSVIRALAATSPSHGLGVPLFGLAFAGAAHRRGGPLMA